MKRFLAILIPVVILGLLLIWKPWEDGDEGQEGKRFRYAFEVETTVLDPARVSDAYASRVLNQVFEGLVALDEENEIIPCLAEEWQMEAEGKRWIFKLRDGVKFHRSDIFGEAETRTVDAGDVEFSFTRLLGPGSTSGYAIDRVMEGAAAFSEGKAKSISGIEVLAPDSVAFELLAPDPLFPRRLSSVILAVLPKEIGSLPGGTVFGADVIVGTGPFKVSTRNDTNVDLVRNENYWGSARGNVDFVEVKVIKSDALRLAAARNGEVDLSYVPLLLAGTVAEPSGTGFQLMDDNQKARLTVHRTLNSTFLGLNCDKLDVPFRRALVQAVDRTALTSLFLQGTTVPSAGPVPLSIQGYSEPVDASSGPNLEDAKASLAQSAFIAKSMEILVHEKEGSEQIGQLLQEQFRKIGIEVNLTKLEYGTVLQRMVSGDYDACLMSFEYVYSTPAPILEGLLNPERIPAPNFWRYDNQKVTDALMEFRKAATVGETNDLASRITGMLLTDPPAVYLYQTLTPVLYSDRVSEIPVNGHSVPMLWKATVD